MDSNKNFDLYKDVQLRTGGDIYIGVVGPVRTGKSSFIKRFMDEMVLPNMEDGAEKTRLIDELPQSGTGKMITTTEPKFIPKDAACIQLAKDVNVHVRMVDCVGYMVDGALGHLEDDIPRMVKTPWFEEDIPFTKAASLGTKKVIQDHSTVGVVVTCDGSFTDIPRNSYVEAEKMAIRELQMIKKPFVVILNSVHPYSDETKILATELEQEYGVIVLPMNCSQMNYDDIQLVLESLLYEFPVTVMEFYMPKWVEMLGNDHPFKREIINSIKELTTNVSTMRDIIDHPIVIQNEYVKCCITERIGLEDGVVKVILTLEDSCYYKMLSEMTGSTILNEYDLIHLLKEFGTMQSEYKKILQALETVRGIGYGVVTPNRDEIILDKPEVIKHGSKYGVKIRATSPSIHFIKANVITEIAPIVGTEKQAQDLIHYITESNESGDSIWDTNIFGKTVEQLVNDGISNKISQIGEDTQLRLQETLQKIVNESTGGFICIII